MSVLSPFRWPALAAAVLAGAVQAQPSTPAAPAVSPGSAASANASGSPPAWRSAFEGYRPFDDAGVAPWRAANDTVGRIGGWRAYAREAQGPAPAPASAPAAAGHRH